MTWRRKPPEEKVPNPTTSPQLNRVRALAQKAAQLGEQVERELAKHITEGHPDRER